MTIWANGLTFLWTTPCSQAAVEATAESVMRYEDEDIRRRLSTVALGDAIIDKVWSHIQCSSSPVNIFLVVCELVVLVVLTPPSPGTNRTWLLHRRRNVPRWCPWWSTGGDITFRVSSHGYLCSIIHIFVLPIYRLDHYRYGGGTTGIFILIFVLRICCHRCMFTASRPGNDPSKNEKENQVLC